MYVFGTLRCGQLFPGGLVQAGNLAILDGPACGSAITERTKITAAVSTSGALLQAFVQRMLHISAARSRLPRTKSRAR